tara:strand:- start:330 stop:602 length:273 start_codon:yes stop_codon:yes gene_type:complete
MLQTMHLNPSSCACQWFTRDALDLVLPVGTVTLDMAPAFTFEALLWWFTAMAIMEADTINARATKVSALFAFHMASLLFLATIRSITLAL